MLAFTKIAPPNRLRKFSMPANPCVAQLTSTSETAIRVIWTTGEQNEGSKRFYDRLGMRREKKVYFVMDP
mgnify:CR=1 FL=1